MTALHRLMGQLSAASGLDFTRTDWVIHREHLWRADAGHGMTVLLSPTRGAVVIDHARGAHYFESPSTRLSDVSTTVAFGLLAVRLDTPTPTLRQRILARLRRLL